MPISQFAATLLIQQASNEMVLSRDVVRDVDVSMVKHEQSRLYDLRTSDDQPAFHGEFLLVFHTSRKD